MAEGPKTFSESWYRVADQKISLRPHAKARRQFFRGQQWYVLHDPFSNQFYRLRAPAYQFVARLRPDRTVEEVWKDCLEIDPEHAPGQEEVIQLLAQLHHANLLHSNVAPDSTKLFERYEKRRKRETRSKLLNIMFVRFPLLDPDLFLKKTMVYVGKCLSPIGAVAWLLVVGMALKIVLENFGSLMQQSQGVLAPSNLFLLYVGMVFIKAFHEFGHAYMCRKFGGEVHVMGVMLLVFTPIPYVDATSSWSFRERWQRALVGAAGMIVELFVAACATFIWANTGPGVVHSLAYNMMFVASVSTVLFNANPLLRFDGYYILSDWLDIPNLHTRSSQQLKHIVEYYLFGFKKSKSPAQSQKEAGWLVFFGLASGIYRIFVFAAIVLFVADKFLLAGMIMAAICIFSWGLVPVGKLIHYLVTSPKLERTRTRASAVVAATVVLVLALLRFIPFPHHFRAPGVLQAEHHAQVVNNAPGTVERILTPTGQSVRVGDPLLRLQDPALDYETAAALAQLRQLKAVLRQALKQEAADVKPVQSNLEAVRRRLLQLEERKDSLVIRAVQQGIWVAPDVQEYIGMWLPRGTMLGEIVDPGAFHFYAIIGQQEASRLFRDEMRKSEVRLFGQAALAAPVRHLKMIQAEKAILPSAALGWLAGGEIAVDVTDPQGLRTTEPFFEVRAEIEPAPTLALFHGRTGKIRFKLDPQPLLLQWWRKFRQLLQERYQF